MDTVTTTDLSEFGYREREEAELLLKAWREQGLPDDFNNDKVIIMMNRSSGNVFLTNDDYQVAMLNGNKLESFYSCPNCGNEGFNNEYEFVDNDGFCSKECKES